MYPRPALSQQLERTTLAAQDKTLGTFLPRRCRPKVVVNRAEPEFRHLLTKARRMARVLTASEQPRVNHLVQKRFAQRIRTALEVFGRQLDQRRFVGNSPREIREPRVVGDAMRGNLAAEMFVVELREEEL